MRTVRMLGEGRVDVIDVPEPEPGAEEVVVRVMASPVCGSERHVYEDAGGLGAAQGFNGGHEAAGVVSRAGAAARLKEGDRVALHAATPCGHCRHCLGGHWVLCEGAIDPRRFPGNHAECVRLHERSCLALADDIPFEAGALFGDAVGTPFRAVKRLGVSGFETVLITGQGPIGLAATLLCRFLNAFVIALDVNSYRLERAKVCGADVCINPREQPDLLAHLAEVAGPRGIDVALECSADPQAQTLCMDALAKSGRMALVGVTNKGPDIDTMRHFTLKEITVIGTWYSAPADHFELEALVRRGLPVSQLVTHRFGMSEAPAAFDAFFDGRTAKVVIEPWR